LSVPQENTLTATAGAGPRTEIPVEPARFQAQLDAANKRIEALEAQLRRRNDYQVSYAQQLFLKNLGMVNSPSVTKAWEATEEQLKFLGSKGIL
jgi:hypothetical protein